MVRLPRDAITLVIVHPRLDTEEYHDRIMGIVFKYPDVLIETPGRIIGLETCTESYYCMTSAMLLPLHNKTRQGSSKFPIKELNLSTLL